MSNRSAVSISSGMIVCGSNDSLCVPLRVNARIDVAGQPVTVGVPFPRGVLREPEKLWLANADGMPVPLQVKPLARWADGSIKWLLCDFVIERVPAGSQSWQLCQGEHPVSSGCTIRE